jgi:predicted MFS family arabinose efflux permease
MFSFKRVLVVVGLMLSTGSFLSGLAPSLPLFLVGRVLTGLAGGTMIPAASIMVLEMSPVKRRGLFIGLLNSSYTVSRPFSK